MKQRFDPQTIRERLLGSNGCDWVLEHRFEDSKANDGLGAHASFDTDTAVECMLVGFHQPAQRLLQRALEWVQVAIAENEWPQSYFPGRTGRPRLIKR